MSAHPALSAVARRAAQRAAVRPPLPASPLLHLSAAPAAHESAAHAGPSRVSQQAARRQLHSSAFAASPLATPLRAVQLRHAVLSCEASSSASRAMHTSAACAFQSSSSRSRDSRSQRGGSSDRGARGGARGGGRGGRGGRAPGAYFARPSAAPAFGPTSKITPEKAAQEALDQITDMRKDTALRHMFVALGLRGEGPRALVADEAVTEDGDAEIVGLLIDRWAEEVQPLIRKALALHLEGDLEAQEGWSIAELQAAHTAEAEQGIARIANASLVQHLIAQLNALATSGQAEIAASARAVAQQLAEVTRLMDLRNPALDYPTARSLTRHIHLHVGPTNSGKTYGALVALCKARNGIYAGPLRLLAHEVWERINAGAVSADIAPRACSLLTGEERQLQLACGLTACTVEMLATNISYDIAVVDEIQMIADKDRGYAWTQAVLGLAAKELHLCGEASVVPLIRRMAEACGDVVHVHEYKRLTPLVVEEKTLGGIRNVRPGDCVVSFSRSGIFKLKEKIEEATGLKCALAYGALPPETKSEQAKMFNDPQSGVDVMVASDAIGMGLNLKIKRVVFESLHKWNGKEQVFMSASQIKQIAGRAGRYGTGKAGEAADANRGSVTTMDPQDLPVLRQALESPLVPIEQAALQPRPEAMPELGTLMSASSYKPVDDKPKPASKQRKQDEADDAAAEEEAGETQVEPVSATLDYGKAPTLSAVLEATQAITRVDHRSYFLSQFNQAAQISPLVEAAARQAHLPFSERQKFSNAPVNTRDERVTASMYNAVRAYARGELVRFEEVVRDLGMLEALEEIEQVRRGAEERKAQAVARGTPISKLKSLASYASADDININTLMLLESLHRTLCLYLWLSFRFPLAFCHHHAVEDYKLRDEEAIQFCLETIRDGRARRMQAREFDRAAERGYRGSTGGARRGDDQANAAKWALGSSTSSQHHARQYASSP